MRFSENAGAFIVSIETMAKKKHSLIDFPEEVDKKTGVKIYGETSYENQIAVLSHYLHNSGEKLSKKRKEEIIEAIRDFLNRKNLRQINIGELTYENLWQAAETPNQYSFFDEFFNVPFPGPQSPRFTFIDLFAGIGGFRIAMQNLGGKCVYSSEFDAKAQVSYLANY